MKDFKYYDSSALYPNRKSDFGRVHVYNDGQVLFSGTRAEYDDVKGTFPHNSIVDHKTDMVALQAAKDAFELDRRAKLYEFRRDLLVEFGVSDHAKATKCFDIAWDYGHAHGFDEVYSHFETIVPLIQN